jgi:hypothetical protein
MDRLGVVLNYWTRPVLYCSSVEGDGGVEGVDGPYYNDICEE